MPTSAALVVMPPPNLAKTETKLAPKPRPTRAFTSFGDHVESGSLDMPRLTTVVFSHYRASLKVTSSAFARPPRQPEVVLTLASTDTIIPKIPLRNCVSSTVQFAAAVQSSSEISLAENIGTDKANRGVLAFR